MPLLASASLDLDAANRTTGRRAVKPNYGSFKECIIKATSSANQCKLFCGGNRCKYCRPDIMNGPQAIPTLYSHWICPDIVASARPITETLKTHNLTKALKMHGIKSVINLQRQGEHKDCGGGIGQSGFSYDPEDFMQAGLFHYNFGWPDFGTTSLATLHNMVKVMSFAISQGKVLIHCHAGLGRTGVLISCYLVWKERYSPDCAIEHVRNKRPGSVQTRDQVEIVYRFAEFLKPLHKIFYKSPNISKYCQHQRLALHGNEERTLRFVPKIIYVIMERLMELCDSQPDGELKRRLSVCSPTDESVLNDVSTLYAFPKGSPRSLWAESPRLILPPITGENIFRPKLKHSFSDEPNSLPSTPGSCRKKRQLSPIPAASRSSSHTQSMLREGMRSPKTPENSDDVAKWFNSIDMHKGPDTSDDLTTSVDGSDASWIIMSEEEDPQTLMKLLDHWFLSLEEAVISCSIIMPGVPFEDIMSQRLSKASRSTLLYVCGVFSALCGKDERLINTGARLMARWLSKYYQEDVDHSVLSFYVNGITNAKQLNQSAADSSVP